MRRIWVIVIAMIFLFPAAVNGAGTSASVYLDGAKLNFTSPPIETQGTTLVPLRTIFEGLGATVTWNPATQTVKATKNTTTIQIIIGQTVAFRNGESIKLLTQPKIVKGVTYVPLRFISESFGCTIEVKGKTIVITSPKSSTTVTPMPTATPAPVTAGTNGVQTVEQIGKLSDRVVYIEVYDKNGKALGSGSGVVVGSAGLILTNYHVVEGASSAKVEFTNQKSYTTSTILLQDEKRDLALLSITADGLPTVTVGDSSSLSLGEQVVAIGSPLGLKNTLTVGVVSTTDRTVEGQHYIQISAPIDHGSSGGALFNMKGELVGVTSALIESFANLNLAIPSNDVKAFMKLTPSAHTMVSSATAVAGSAMSAESLEKYMNDNYSDMSYNDLDLTFDWYVFKMEDGTFGLSGVMYDGTEWADWVDELVKDDDDFSSMIYYFSEELRKDLKLTDTFFSLYLNVHLKNYPSSFPAASITQDSTGYELNYNFASGMVDYSTGYFYYNLTPEDEKAIERVKIK